ncbi:hypothetical protein MRB53_041103 [Persea americana]|nr:hypothetical protein MRB53_041103 [Persea americana]
MYPPPTSPSPDGPSATHRTLTTTELLEEILLNLDNQTLLLSQRVNHTFKSTITGSIKLQKKLFFRLADEDEDEGVKYGDEGINPLARKVPHLTFTTTTTKYGRTKPEITMTWALPKTHDPSAHDPPPSWRRMYIKHGPLRKSSGRRDVWTNMVLDILGTGLGERPMVPVKPWVMGTYENVATHYLSNIMAWAEREVD